MQLVPIRPFLYADDDGTLTWINVRDYLSIEIVDDTAYMTTDLQETKTLKGKIAIALGHFLCEEDARYDK